ncbi:MAG TPA: SDR family NAD(P)-dependent oxidoreductase [Candidatus Saccharimonadales bacterium]|nr:SDR family NAD(P)-dependent oxidoreductase [Candidatus Saccharimonadales bacterium]
MAQMEKTNTENRVSAGPSGRVAVVTGGSRGIGRAVALRLAALGYSVAICGRDEAALEQARQEISQSAAPVLSLSLDVTHSDKVSAAVRKVEETWGPISVLVNSAGIGGFGPAHLQSEADWDRVLDTNLKSVFLLSRAVAPSMIQRGAGDIINISSLAGHSAFAGGGLYCASKWGLQGLSACMAEDLREHGVRVSVIAPGSVATGFSGRGPKDPRKTLAAEDVAHAVAAIVTQSPQSFISEIQLRPLRK